MTARPSALTMEGAVNISSFLTHRGGRGNADAKLKFRAPPYGDPFAGNKMLPGEIGQHYISNRDFVETSSCPGETEAMWKKWYEAQGYDTTNWSEHSPQWRQTVMIITAVI